MSTQAEHRNVNVLFFGPPGAGKGTQAALVAPALGMAHVSTGELFRQHQREGTTLGLRVKAIMDAGEYVPDDLTVAMLEQHIRDLTTAQPGLRGVIFDGFPRTLPQVESLDAFLRGRGEAVDAVVYLGVPLDVLLTRLQARGRTDDTPEAVTVRFNKYTDATAPLVAAYEGARCAGASHQRRPSDGAGHGSGGRRLVAALCGAGVAMARGGGRAAMTLKSPQEIEQMRAAGQLTAQALEAMRQFVRPGVTTAEVDAVAARVIREGGAKAAFYGQYGFPATVCVAVNEQVVHGIPGPLTLREGDIISLDTGAILDGWYGDATITVPVGAIAPEVERLVADTYAALMAGIAQCVPGKRLGDIGHAIQRYGESRGYGVVRQYVGHAVGRALHEEPQVPNFGKAGTGVLLRAGMVLTIEPMLTLGSYETHILADKWTVVTDDGEWAAQFEHTVAITNHGPDVLTLL